MTDIRRTLLWVVFGMSVLLLWDAWQRHTGHPSMFAPQASRPAATAGSAPGSAGGNALPAATGSGTTTAAAPSGAASAPVASECFV